MYPRLILGLTAASLALSVLPASAEKPTSTDVTSVADDPALRAMEKLRLSIQRVTLENGLRVVLNPDQSSPTVAISVTYDVGSANEEKGQSGFAHLFEHMMFQGSKNVEKGGHFTLISARGGTLNGTTSKDRTNYYEMLPANELALGLWLEADRMKSLDVTAENFENQRAVVQEEYRMRVENAAYRMGMIRLDELVYQGFWPYEHSTIGSMDDLNNAKLEWVQAFFDKYYAPNNAVLTIAGAFEPDSAMELVRKYFGDAEPQKNVPPLDLSPPPEQTAERRDTVMDPHAKTPGLFLAWRIPDTHSAEHYALELAAMILTDGESSRLYERFVRDKAIARDVSAWTGDSPGPDDLTLMVLLTEKAQLDAVEVAVQEQVELLGKRGPSAEELEKAKNRLRASFIFGIQSNLSRATRLGEYEAMFGDARLLTRELSGYLSVTPKDVQAAVAKYLTVPRRSVIHVKPAVGAVEAK